jgi:hypothetical protein
LFIFFREVVKFGGIYDDAVDQAKLFHSLLTSGSYRAILNHILVRVNQNTDRESNFSTFRNDGNNQTEENDYNLDDLLNDWDRTKAFICTLFNVFLVYMSNIFALLFGDMLMRIVNFKSNDVASN